MEEGVRKFRKDRRQVKMESGRMSKVNLGIGEDRRKWEVEDRVRKFKRKRMGRKGIKMGW